MKGKPGELETMSHVWRPEHLQVPTLDLRETMVPRERHMIITT